MEKRYCFNCPPLDQKIEEIKTQTGSQKVDLVAHSMGGLVARNYIADPTRASKVRKLITLGTPYLGAVKFLSTLFSGTCLYLEAGPFCFSIAPSETKDIIQNMIGGYELAPSQKYYDFYNGSDNNRPLPFVDNRDIDQNSVIGFLDYSQTKSLLTNLNFNTSLFIPTETFHALDNNLADTNDVDVNIISGSGKPTLGQIIEDYYLNFAGIKIPKTDIRNINGDGTVPLYSAALVDGSKSLLGSAKVFYANQKHPDLVFNGSAMNLVKNILANDSNLPTGISTTPYQFAGTGLSVHSPVLIHAYDQNHNHTGPLPNGDYETNIPGSSYDVLGDAKFIFLPDDGVYTLKFEATDQGSFDLKIRNYKNDINDKTILYKSVPLTNITKAETIFDTNSSTPPILQVDNDGNGTMDSQFNSTSNLIGNANYDQTPPKTTIKLTGTLGNNNWYKNDVSVELNATDEANGSGILKTEYSLDDGQAIHTFTTPFVISSEDISKLRVKSIDNAGNEETPQEVEIKIDKTAPEAKIAFNLQNQSFETTGIDTLSNIQITSSNKITVLTDEAGNTTKLLFESKDHEKYKLSFKSIIYNENPPIIFPENEFEVELKQDKKTNFIKEFQQNLEIKKQIQIESEYNAKKDLTQLQIEVPKSKNLKLEKAGIVLLQLLTNKGKLEAKY